MGKHSMKPDERLVQLTQREVELLLRYAYPFEAEAAKLRACKPRKGWYDIQIGAFWLSQSSLVRIGQFIRVAEHEGRRFEPSIGS